MMSLPVWLPGPMILPGVFVLGPMFLWGSLCLVPCSFRGTLSKGSLPGGLCPGGLCLISVNRFLGIVCLICGISDKYVTFGFSHDIR